MKFFKQLKIEIKNILGMKFVIIIAILALLLSVVWPVYNAIKSPDNKQQWVVGARPLMETMAPVDDSSADDYYYGEEPIIIDGVTIAPDNPFYYEIKWMKEQLDNFDAFNKFEHEGAKELKYELLEEMYAHNVRLAKSIKVQNDYRLDLIWMWQKSQLRAEKFIHEHITTSDFDALIEAVRDYYWYDPYNTEMFENKFVNISSIERLKAIEDAEAYYTKLYAVLESNDFEQYIFMRIDIENENIENNNKAITALERQIIDDPSLEESLKWQIDDLNRQNDYIQSNTIPILKYRLEKNIIPNDGSWQNDAMRDIENAKSRLIYEVPVTEKEFNEQYHLKEQYGTYSRYLDAINKLRDSFSATILIAENSIDSDMPDLKYAPDGTRNQALNFLVYGSIIGMLAIMLGGWMMASEFQLGTIRLLMIRPCSRTKILMSKFAAALLFCISLYLAGVILNFVMNGVMFGFSDYANPSYSASGQIGFLAYYLPKMLACIVPIIFAYCFAFMLSTTVKNVAVAISVPAVCFIGCVIVMSIIKGRIGGGFYPMPIDAYYYGGSNVLEAVKWLAWTPVPFVLLSDFFTLDSVISRLIESGVPIYLAYGLSLFAVLSVVCTAVSVWIFRKRDITQ
ncbi:MAG: ABC transporter permease [Christensenellales bacterium]